MKRVVILTGSELRHDFFRLMLSIDNRYVVTKSYCEGLEQSLKSRVVRGSYGEIQHEHVRAREQAEKDFFQDFVELTPDRSNPVFIEKGAINNLAIVEAIISDNPDLLVCFGCSLIKSDLVTRFAGRILNVHLGLSPYYRGSGTNVWPIIDGVPSMVGATFMFLDAGIDTGQIIHQIEAEHFLGDSPHSVGNRLIRKMTGVYSDIIADFDSLCRVEQPVAEGKLCKRADFTDEACEALYSNCTYDKFFVNRASKVKPFRLVRQVFLKT